MFESPPFFFVLKNFAPLKEEQSSNYGNQEIFSPRQNEGRSYLGVGGDNTLRAMMIWMDQSPNQKTNKALRKY